MKPLQSVSMVRDVRVFVPFVVLLGLWVLWVQYYGVYSGYEGYPHMRMESKAHIGSKIGSEDHLRESTAHTSNSDTVDGKGDSFREFIGDINPKKSSGKENYLRESMFSMSTDTPFGKGRTKGAFMKQTGSVLRSKEFPHMPDPCIAPRRQTDVKDFLCMEPLTFLPSYKNPCWMGQNSRLRCLPYFHLFGMSKSGTTDLFTRLYLHPEIVPIKARGNSKEINFWTGGVFKTGNNSLGSYSGRVNTEEIESALDDNGYHYKITGYGDPHDMWKRFRDVEIPQNNPGDEEMTWTMPYLERRLNPGVKLLLLLRDPVERLYSVFYFARQGNSSQDFDNKVAHDLVLLRNCTKNHTLRHCILDGGMKRQFKTRMYSSFYAELLRDWLRAFPREQILILRNEDYAKDIPGTMEKIFTFLNVSIPDPSVINKMSDLPHAYVTKAKAAAEPMSRRTRMILTRLYKQSGEDLAKMLGDEKFTFKDVQKI